MIGRDPIESLASGTIRSAGDERDLTLRFETSRFNFTNPPRSTGLRNWQCFEGMVLAVSFMDDAQHSVLGSAVMVAPGVAVSATHTFEEHLPQIQRGELGLAAFGIASDGVLAWEVRFVQTVVRTDLCILGLRFLSEPPASGKVHMATITTRLPSIGETVVVGGFRASREEIPLTPPALELEGRMLLTSGSITQSFPQGRDSMLVPWPSLEVDAPLFGGMSGGPVFDERGGLIGVGSRSMEMGPGEEPSPMIVALLWPALGTPFPVSITGDKTSSLLSLHGRYISIERPEAVTAEAINTSAGPGLKTSYTPWA